MKIERRDGLEIEEDIVYQRRFHVFQRVMWALMVIIIVLAVAGLIGPGLAGRSAASSADGRLGVSFYKGVNYMRDSQVVLVVKGSGKGAVSVWLSRAYLDSVHLTQVLPEPERVTASPARVHFVFDNMHAGELEITFFIQPVSAGWLEANAGEGPSELSFRQFIFP